MKSATSLLAALLLAGSFMVTSAATASDEVSSKTELTPGSYCHEQFPAIRGKTLADDNPVLKSENTGDVIDYYGSCNENPVGQDQVRSQQLDQQHRWENDFAD
jgi:hypothetical protein